MSHHHQIPRKSMKPVNHDPQTLTTTSFSTISASCCRLGAFFSCAKTDQSENRLQSVSAYLVLA
jgi:hypothetical protein